MMQNILSIDVEELFHAEYVKGIQSRTMEYRTSQNIPDILDFLDKHKVTATFFVVGELADRFPKLIKIISDAGHEVAFHGWSHLTLGKLTPNLFRSELRKFKRICPGCIGYRAPSFSLNNNTNWALEVLEQEEFRYDSSIFPTWTPLYGSYRAPMKPYFPIISDVSKETKKCDGILEFPLAVYNLFGLKLPISGGFWLRFLGSRIIKRGIEKLNENGIPAVLFLHNWELDPNTFRYSLDAYKSFVTYYNIAKTKQNLKNLFKQSNFTSFENFLAG